MNKEIYKMDGKWVFRLEGKVLDVFPTKKKAEDFVAQYVKIDNQSEQRVD